MAKTPFLGVPGGPDLCVENPDGIFMGAKHNLYDGPRMLDQPIIPGNYDVNRPVYDEPEGKGRAG